MIIIVCLIVIIGEIANSSITSSQAFKLGKVLRIFRLFLMFRKMNNIKKFKDKITNKKQATVNVSSPSEKIIEILTGIMDSEWISYQNELKQDLAWCITMIKEQKIYQTSVRAAKEELIDLVSWAVNQNLFNDPESPTNPSAYSKALTLKKFSPEIESLISNCHEWDFDIFKLEQISESHSLEILVSHLFVLYNLCHTLCLDSLKFSSFTQAIEEGYHKSNTYHNATHAADVVQSYYYFLSTCQAIQICHLPDWDIAVALFSAAIHDYDHPGLNNLFLINSSNTLAMTYNDRSVLENHHVSSALRLLQEEKHNFLDRVGKDDRKKFRMKAISLVLATDFARHFSDLGKFQLKFSNNTVKDEEDRLMVLEMLMHASDVGNPSRPWKVCHEWALRVMSEFFAQGDKERELGLPISNLCDRFGVNIAKSQIGFAELFIEPTFAVLELLLPAVSVNARHLAENKEKWKEAMETEKGKD